MRVYLCVFCHGALVGRRSVTRLTSMADARVSRVNQVMRERNSPVFKRAVAELREFRSASARRTPPPSIRVPVIAQPSSRSGTPHSCTSRGTSPRPVQKPPPVEPMSRGSPRRLELVQKTAYKDGTYYRGDSLQTEVKAMRNTAPSMASSVPRFEDIKPQHSAQPPERVAGLALEQKRSGNSGVGFSMTSPRSTAGKSHADPYGTDGSVRVISRPLGFSSVSRSAVWQTDLEAQRRRVRDEKLLKELGAKEFTRLTDEWVQAESVSVERQLEALDYTIADASTLAKVIQTGCKSSVLTNADRHLFDEFKRKIIEACIDRLRRMDAAECDEQLVAHGYDELGRKRLLRALRVNFSP